MNYGIYINMLLFFACSETFDNMSSNYLPINYSKEQSNVVGIIFIIAAVCSAVIIIFWIWINLTSGGVKIIKHDTPVAFVKPQLTDVDTAWIELRKNVINSMKNIVYKMELKNYYDDGTKCYDSLEYYKKKNQYNFAHMYNFEVFEKYMHALKDIVDKDDSYKNLSALMIGKNSEELLQDYVITIEDYITYYYFIYKITLDDSKKELFLTYLMLGVKLYKRNGNNFYFVVGFKGSKDNVGVKKKIDYVQRELSKDNPHIICALSMKFIDCDIDIDGNIDIENFLKSNYFDCSYMYLFSSLIGKIDLNSSSLSSKSGISAIMLNDFNSKTFENLLFFRLSHVNLMTSFDVLKYIVNIKNLCLFINNAFPNDAFEYIGFNNSVYIIDVLCGLFSEFCKNGKINSSSLGALDDIIKKFIIINCMDKIVELKYDEYSKGKKDLKDYYVPSNAFEKYTILKLADNKKLKWLNIDLFKFNTDKKYIDVSECKLCDNTGPNIKEINGNDSCSVIDYIRNCINDISRFYEAVDNNSKSFISSKSGIIGDIDARRNICNFLFKSIVKKSEILNVILMYNNFEVFKFILNSLKDYLISNGSYKSDKSEKDVWSKVIDSMYKTIGEYKNPKILLNENYEKFDLMKSVELFSALYNDDIDIFDVKNNEYFDCFMSYYVDNKTYDYNVMNTLWNQLKTVAPVNLPQKDLGIWFAKVIGTGVWNLMTGK